jgi:ferredoxin-nitrite reductase
VAWIELPSALWSHTGQLARVEVAGRSVGEALTLLTGRYPLLAGALLTPEGRLRRSVLLFIGEDDVRTLGGLDAPLSPGARLLVVMAVAGG